MAQGPQLGAEVWLEPQFTQSHIDSLFRIMNDYQMKVARIFIFPGDYKIYDNAFSSAQKYNIKIQATFSFSEHPYNEDELAKNSQYINDIVRRYKNNPALETWWLINEPGNGPSSKPFALQQYRKWLEKKYNNINSLNNFWGKYYTSFTDIQFNENWSKPSVFSNPIDFLDWFQFSRDNLTWIITWISNEVKKEDNFHQIHVNPFEIFNNLSQYDFPAWRSSLTSLGASIHPSGHFGMLKRNQFSMGIAATSEIIKGASEPNPFWVSELQSGNNIWSGAKPLGPKAEDIAQWTWTSIGCGAEKVIYWMLNNRTKGGESGEWSILDFQGNASDRLIMASKIAQTINKEKIFFSEAKPIERKVVILLSPESMLISARKSSRDSEIGRGSQAHILSALSYYQALSELGIPTTFKYINDFDWENKLGFIAILPNVISVQKSVVKRLEQYVANGNKLIIDGLTGYFDENEVNVLQSSFFFEKLCGATVKDIRTIDHLFKTNLDKVSSPLPVHLWQTEISNTSAKVIGRDNNRITAVRNIFGKGEVVWIPMLIGLGAWLDKNDALAEFLSNETKSLSSTIPIKFKQKTNNVIIQTLKKGDTYVSVITNGTSNIQEITLELNAKLKPNVIFNTESKAIDLSSMKLTLGNSQTIVIKWVTDKL